MLIVNPGPCKVFEQYKWVNRAMKTETMGDPPSEWIWATSSRSPVNINLRLMLKVAGAHGVVRNTPAVARMTLQHCVPPVLLCNYNSQTRDEPKSRHCEKSQFHITQPYQITNYKKVWKAVAAQKRVRKHSKEEKWGSLLLSTPSFL